MVCFWLSSPASARICVARIYGTTFNPLLLPVAATEQLLLLLGAVLQMLLDLPVTSALLAIALLKPIVPRAVLVRLTGLALAIYAPLDAFCLAVDTINTVVNAAMVGFHVLHCRGRATARLYRIPMLQMVRTGRSSNHAWKFGDWNGETYYRCSDMVLLNPRISKLGVIEPNRLMFRRHKLLWSSIEGVRYVHPVLSCGDNSVSRRTSIVTNLKSRRQLLAKEHAPVKAADTKAADTNNGTVAPFQGHADSL
jgi:hypothetical protein